MTETSAPPPSHRTLLALSLGALGVVYGDIGTSPLYALREAFHGPFGIAPSPAAVLGVLSLMIWSLAVVVILKYLVLLLRADHQGQGGILALLTLLTRSRKLGGWRREAVTALALAGAALLYGDGVITPAISVLSAVEGLAVTAPALVGWVVPATVVILLGLFGVQSRGTGRIAAVFGPLILLWFATLGLLGLRGIAACPTVLQAFNPVWALRFFASHGPQGFFVLSAVVLVVTGGEALYADLGHFGRAPIRLAWFTIALPGLLANYLGQGALLLRSPEAAGNPFYALAPASLRLPLVLLATAATVVASQALISASFSLSQQLVNLGYLPRMSILHTSARMAGQIYVPQVNRALLAACLVLVLAFRSSSALAAAYGLAVVGTMMVTTLLFFAVARLRWRWSLPLAAAVTAIFLGVEAAFLGANLGKVAHGGWVPLVIGAGLYLLMSTWRQGRRLLAARFQRGALSWEALLKDIAAHPPARVPGHAVFLSRQQQGVPAVLLHHLKHTQVLHQQVLVVTAVAERIPAVPAGEQVEVEDLGHGFYRLFVHHGFMEVPDLARILARDLPTARPVEPAKTSFFLGRETILADGKAPMARWRKRLFGLLARNAGSPTHFFRLPPNRVVELGTLISF